MMDDDNFQHNLETIPEEIVYQHIFPLLKHNDIVRLRRVSKRIKLIADDYIQNHFTHQEWEVNETSHTFRAYIQPHLPTSRLYLNNSSGPQIFEDRTIPEFLRLHGNKITHLRVKHFSTCIWDTENNFFLGLPNLQHLELEHTDASSRKLGHIFTSESGVMVPRELCYFPPTFKNLKTLILGEIDGSDDLDQNYAMDIIEFCCNLEYISHPLYTNMVPGSTMYREGPFGCVTENVRKRLVANPNEPIKLKYYDLKNHIDEGFYQLSFLCLLELCHEHNIKLLNVNASIFHAVGTLLASDQVATTFMSVINVHSLMFTDDLPNIKKVVISSTKLCSYDSHQLTQRRPTWSNLKDLSIHIDSAMVGGAPKSSSTYVRSPTSRLLDFFFANGERTKLQKLQIGFSTEALFVEKDHLFYQSIPDIVTNCSYLTKLTLSNWIGTDQSVSELWTGLELLEVVELENCRKLGNNSFIGPDRANPPFLKLSKMKKFTLRGLESMPKITDHVFDSVFRHLRIKELHLISSCPVRSITTNGIRALLTGEFNNSVEKFPFRGWSLENVSVEQFHQLKSEFRATSMR